MFMCLRHWVFGLFLLAGLPVTLPLAAAEYPSPATHWSEREYIDFYFLHYNTHQALPHLRNAESRALFERLTDRANIGRILDGSAARLEKQRQLQMILAAMGGIRGAYNLALMIGEPLREELVRVQIFHLYLIGVVAEFEEDVAAARGGPAMKTAWLGVIQSLSEEGMYSTAQIAALSDAAARRYPSIRELFTARERTMLRGRIEALQAKQTATQSRLALSRLLATVAED